MWLFCFYGRIFVLDWNSKKEARRTKIIWMALCFHIWCSKAGVWECKTFAFSTKMESGKCDHPDVGIHHPAALGFIVIARDEPLQSQPHLVDMSFPQTDTNKDVIWTTGMLHLFLWYIQDTSETMQIIRLQSDLKVLIEITTISCLSPVSNNYQHGFQFWRTRLHYNLW